MTVASRSVLGWRLGVPARARPAPVEPRTPSDATNSARVEGGTCGLVRLSEVGHPSTAVIVALPADRRLRAVLEAHGIVPTTAVEVLPGGRHTPTVLIRQGTRLAVDIRTAAEIVIRLGADAAGAEP